MKNKILYIIILLLVTNIPISAKALESGVTIPLVADKISDTGEEGSYLNAQVIVTSGTGHVFVDTNPFTQVDLQGSARIAAMVATDVLGVNENSYDFYYIIEVGSPVIGGPSAGGALTVATIAAINNWTIKPGVVMTGMIDPDETIGPVGGIPYKLQAAAKKDTSLFLVPQGQLIVNETNASSLRRGPIVMTTHSIDTVDLRVLGKKYNVDVKEVSTIQDAVLAFTGHDISKPIINKTVYTSNYLKLLQPLALKLENESKNMLNSSSQISNDNIKRAKDLQSKADSLINDKKYYAATSLYFESTINILIAKWNYEYNQANSKDKYLANLVNSVENQIQNSEKELIKFKANGISDVEVIGATESRIAEANFTLENSKNLISQNANIDDILTSLAFANQRARTAQWWLTLATPSENVIPESVLKERAGWYLGQAQSVRTYVQTLISESGASLGNLGDLTVAQKEMENGFYSGAIFDSLQSISRSSVAIDLAGIQDIETSKIVTDRIIQSANSAQSAINTARSDGIEPTLAVSLYEYGEILTNPFDKISQYSYAKMVAKSTESLYSHQIPSNQTINNPPEITALPGTTTTAAMKQIPGFDGIILFITLLIFKILKRQYNKNINRNKK